MLYQVFDMRMCDNGPSLLKGKSDGEPKTFRDAISVLERNAGMVKVSDIWTVYSKASLRILLVCYCRKQSPALGLIMP